MIIILGIPKSDIMTRKTYLYEWGNEDLENLSEIEKEAFRKADELNDRILDLKIMIDDMNEGWDEYIQFLEEEKISKYCEFKCQETIEFDEEVLRSIVNTLKKSLTDTNKSINYNSKKIKINRAIEG